MRHPKTRVSLIAASIAATLCAAPPVHAAERALEEVIVTARKRDENLQQVPTAINVMTADALQNRQISNVVDLERTSPNVTMTETGGAQAGSVQIFMRGIGNDNGFDPGIGLYIDDIFVQRAAGGLLDLYDVERIEVLKGPQGNLYGRNTIGGAIKYITKEPNDTPEAQIEGKIGSYNLRQVKASASGPLVDGLLYGGVGMMYKKRDGIQTNVYNGEDLWDSNVYGLRGNLKFTPNDQLTFKLGVDYSHDNSAPRIPHLVAADQTTLNVVADYAKSLHALPSDAPMPDFSGIHASPDKVNSEADYDPYRLQTFTAYFSAQWEISDEWTFKSVTAERKVNQTFVGEFDGSALPYLTNTQWLDSDDWSQEFQLNFSGEKLDAVAGIYYTDGKQDAPSFGVITPYVNVDRTRITDTTKAQTLLKSWSLYGNVDYSLTDALHLSLGARLTNDKKTFKERSFVSYSYLDENPVLISPPIDNGRNDFGPDSKTWRNFSPSAKLAYDFNENTMGYISYSTGFKAGGYNSYPNGSPSITFNPEKVKTYAVGLKTTLLDGTLRLNTEAFYNDYTDKQLQYLANVDNNVTTLFTNAGKVTTQGIETEISWLTPVSGLQFDINIGYLDAKIDKFDRYGRGDVASQSELGFSPRWTVQPRVSYTMDANGLGDLMFAADASYRSRSYTNSPVNRDDAIDSQQVQPEHVIYNANIVFNTADNHWRFALEGRNLTNRRVLTNTFNLDLGLNPASTSTFVLGSYNDPKTWAFSAAYKY